MNILSGYRFLISSLENEMQKIKTPPQDPSSSLEKITEVVVNLKNTFYEIQERVGKIELAESNELARRLSKFSQDVDNAISIDNAISNESIFPFYDALTKAIVEPSRDIEIIIQEIESSIEGLTPLSMHEFLKELKQSKAWSENKIEIMRLKMLERILGESEEERDLFKAIEKEKNPKDRECLFIEFISVFPLEVNKEFNKLLNLLDLNYLKDLPLDERVEIVKKIKINNRIDKYLSRIYLNIFDKLIFKKDFEDFKDNRERALFFIEIVQSPFTAAALIPNLHKFSPGKLDSYSSILKSNLIKELTLQEKLEFLGKVAILSDGIQSDIFLKQLILALDFNAEIHKKTLLEEKLGLIKKIKDLMDFEQSNSVFDSFHEFDLHLFFKGITIDERLNLIEKINGELGNLALCFFNTQLARTGFLEDVKRTELLSEKISLFERILQKGVPSSILVNKWDCEDIINSFTAITSVEEKVDYAGLIAKIGEAGLNWVLNNYKKIGLFDYITEPIELEEKISRLLRLARTDWGAALIATHLSEINIKDVSCSDQLKLALIIISQGHSAVIALSKNFHHLKFLEFDVESILSLVHIMKKNDALDNLTIPSAVKIKEYRQFLLEATLLSSQSRKVPAVPPLDCIMEFLNYDEHSRLETQQIEEFLHSLEGLNLVVDFQQFKDDINEIVLRTKPEDKDYVHCLLWKSLAYTAGVLYDLDSGIVAALQDNPPWIKSILECRRPAFRYSLIRQLSFLNESMLNIDLDGESAHHIRPLILISRLEAIGFITNDEKKVIYNRIKRKDFFRDDGRQSSLNEFLIAVIETTPYLNPEKNELIKVALNKIVNSSKKSLESIRTLNRIRNLFGDEVFIDSLCDPEEKYKAVLIATFKKLFLNLDQIENLDACYAATFDKFRDPNALLTYLSRVKQLPLKEQEATHKALSDYVASVLNGKFYELRYSQEGVPEFEKLFNTPDSLEKWREVEGCRSLVLEDGKQVRPAQTIKEYLKAKIGEGHLTPIENYSLLQNYLNDYLSNTSAFEEVKSDSDEFALLQVQRDLIELCEGQKTLEEFIDGKPNVDLGQLDRDIADLITREAPQRISAFTILETDDPCDLLLIGTEVQGSCQRVDGTPHLNKSLVGYLLNGEIKAIVIKDRGGKIVARAMIRRVWNGEAPLLFLERIYSNIKNPLVDEHIIEWAKRKAESEGVSLISKEVGSGDFYRGNVEILKGRAPFIYSDAIGGILSEKKQIEKCHFLYRKPHETDIPHP